jgi:hypothetical protein
MANERQRPGVVSPEFAKLMLWQIPIGVLMIVVGLVQDGRLATLSVWAGALIVVYSIIGATAIWLLIRRQGAAD